MSNCSKCKQRDKDISDMLDDMYKSLSSKQKKENK